jgi:hypothetical protein
MLVRFFRVRQSLLLENLALRQQLAVLKRRRRSPCLSPFDKLFWVAVSRFWSGWKQALVVVTPETVIRWHRVVFRLLSLAKTLGVLSFTPLTMLQACAQAVDFKVGHHFGEGHPPKSAQICQVLDPSWTLEVRCPPWMAQFFWTQLGHQESKTTAHACSQSDRQKQAFGGSKSAKVPAAI